MSHRPQNVSFPGFTLARQRRRKSTREPVATSNPQPEAAILAFAVMASRSNEQPTVTIPVLEDDRWRPVTLDLGPAATTAMLRSEITRLLESEPLGSAPPPSTAVAVLGDAVVDPSYVAIRIEGGRVTLEGPVEPFGGLAALGVRLNWLIGAVGGDRALGDIDPIAPDEHAGMLVRRMGPKLGPIRHVLSQVEQSARRAPHAAAITTPWTTLTYDELINLVADRHAMLRRKGIGPGDMVGLEVARSTDLVATMLALWEARAAFVPITSDQPRARVVRMLDAAGARRVVTDLGAWRRPAGAITSVEVDRQISERRARPRRHAARSLDADAYVVFTSSEGGPRGISISHQHLAHYLLSVSGVMPGARLHGAMLASTPVTSGASMLELIWPLTHGWEVVIDPGRDVPIGPVARRRRITHLNGTPTSVSLLTHGRDGRQVLETVQHVLLGGEEVDPALVADLEKVTRAELTVRYGTAECTVDVAWGSLGRGASLGGAPLGRVLPGHTVDVVDRNDRTVGAFSQGELVVFGDAVTDGHLGQHQDDAGFFRHGSQRGFRTGDLVWTDTEGNIHFVGRRDRQVKVRGHRVDLAEIDARLRAHPDISASATVALGRADCRRLETFVVTTDSVSDHELNTWLQETLPEAMIPARIHRVPALPTSHTGSDDKLREMALERSSVRQPRRELTTTEAQVAALFEEVLDIAHVEPDRSFFDVGGNAVAAVRLAARLESIVDRRVRVASLLDTGSVEQIARAIDAGRLGAVSRTLVTIVDRGVGLPVYCVAGEDGHAATLRPLGEALDRGFHGLQFAGSDGITAPDATIEAMADRFALAVNEHRGSRPIVLGGYEGGGFVALEMVKRLEALGTRVMLLVLVDSAHPEFETRSRSQKLVDGLRDLRAPDDLSAIRVLRSRLVDDRLSRRDNLFAATRRGRVPSAVDLSTDFERAAAAWQPPDHDGPVLVIRSAAAAQAHRGWERMMSGPFEAVSVDGGHVEMMLPPAVDEVALRLRRAINEIEAPHRS